jgi:fermentation-respiration switch protein FrsA (DUF1100 family)
MSYTYTAKDPTDIRRYELDVSPALPTGATVSAVTTVTYGGGLAAPETPDPSNGVASATVVYAWAAAGTAGQTGTITWTFTTSGGETLQRTATMQIKER